MNERERFLSILAFEPVDRTLMWEWGYWGATLRRWYDEGLPLRVGIPADVLDGDGVRGEASAGTRDVPRDRDVHETMGLDAGLETIPINMSFYPKFERRVLEDHGDWRLVQDEAGITKREFKNHSTLPHFVKGPVATREDWERIRAERLRPELVGRLPGDWEQLKQGYRDRTYPLGIGTSLGLFGTPRALMGVEPLLLAYFDQPALLHDIIDDTVDFCVALLDQVLREVEVDVVFLWEDMCYKAGPLISPTMFRHFMLPGYQKITACVRDHGVHNVLVDTDGDCWRLIPLFLEGGITGLYPFEVNAGMDIVEVRKAFPRLQILGGLDKIAFATGGEVAAAELERKAPPLLRTGGYIPYMDHYVHPEVSWENFVCYRRRLNHLIRETRSS